MLFIAEIDIMPLDNLLDPQGKAVEQILRSKNYDQIEGVRIGKHITLRINANSQQEAELLTDKICNQILHNPIVHKYTFRVRKGE